jgi:hypothetical protein
MDLIERQQEHRASGDVKDEWEQTATEEEELGGMTGDSKSQHPSRSLPAQAGAQSTFVDWATVAAVSNRRVRGRMTQAPITQSQLESYLWGAATLLAG